jgi:hypothetical protein
MRCFCFCNLGTCSHSSVNVVNVGVLDCSLGLFKEYKIIKRLPLTLPLHLIFFQNELEYKFRNGPNYSICSSVNRNHGVNTYIHTLHHLVAY